MPQTLTRVQIAKQALQATGPLDLRQRPLNWSHSTASFSDCRAYRYRLERLAGNVPRHPAVTFIMLNPSTADASEDDPTITRCWRMTQRWCFQRMVVVNLFALRSTDPRRLPKHPDPVGPHNVAFITAAIVQAREAGSPVICAWGCNMPPPLRSHLRVVQSLLREHGGDIKALRLNARREPWHPLYLPAKTEPVPYLAMQGPVI